MPRKKYNYKDFLYDLAYLSVLIGISLLVIGSLPDLFPKVLRFIK